MKTNMSPENWWLEDEMSFWDGPFLGDMFIFGGVPGNSAGDLFGLVIRDPFNGDSWPPTRGIQRSGIESPGNYIPTNEQMLFSKHTLGPQNHEKWRFQTPQYMGEITPKNEGCGFPWVPSVKSLRVPGRLSVNSLGSDCILQLLDLFFRWCFYGFYHGRSPVNHHWGH